MFFLKTTVLSDCDWLKVKPTDLANFVPCFEVEWRLIFVIVTHYFNLVGDYFAVVAQMLQIH